MQQGGGLGRVGEELDRLRRHVRRRPHAGARTSHAAEDGELAGLSVESNVRTAHALTDDENARLSAVSPSRPPT